MTNKTISFNESAHKSRILPKLKFAKQQLAKKSGNMFGKTVNYGDSISIDTESVIYIENGPNYHTYTFNITRTNPQLNDPVENLLLTPLPDGTYKELLISYNFTEQEKTIIENGGFVNTKNKMVITELEGLNIGNNLLSKAGGMGCGWVVDEIVYRPCSENVHDLTNVSEWHLCQADRPPGW